MKGVVKWKTKTWENVLKTSEGVLKTYSEDVWPWSLIYSSSSTRMFAGVIAFRILVKSHKPIYQNSLKKKSLMEFFNCKVTFPNFNERELHHKCFRINFAKFFSTAILTLKWFGVCVRWRGGGLICLISLQVTTFLKISLKFLKSLRSQEEFLCQY